MTEIAGYEVKEDVLDDGTPIFDVCLLMWGDAEHVGSFCSEESALEYARAYANGSDLEDAEIKIHRGAQ